jgi:hypothetical protein
MPDRLSIWFHSLDRKVKKNRWLWVGFILAGLFWDRIFSMINRYVDTRVRRLAPLTVSLSHNRSGVETILFFGTILVLIILAFIETRPVVTKPRMTILPGWRSGGLYDLQANLIGWELPISNTEKRFHTIANNVRAKITFRHALGNRLIADPAVWLVYGQPRSFADRVSIGMGDTARLLVCVARNDAFGHFIAMSPWPLQLDANHRLEFGQWQIEIELSGDNVADSYEGLLTLNPNAAADIRMEP